MLTANHMTTNSPSDGKAPTRHGRTQGPSSKPDGSFMSSIYRLQEGIDRRWRAAQYREPDFPTIAGEELTNAALGQQFSELEIVDWIHSARSLPKQLDPKSKFGNPPITLTRTKNFLIDLYFWVGTNTALHDHGFSGAFANLVGQSLQVEYEFAPTSAPTRSNLGFGNLRLKEIELIAPGRVQLILSGDHFIHAVWHLDMPTITVVVRTLKSTGVVQKEYHYPGIVTLKNYSEPDIVRKRKREMFLYLFVRNHPHKVELATKLVAEADDVDRLWYLNVLRNPAVCPPDAKETCTHSLFRGVHGRWLEQAANGPSVQNLLRDTRFDRATKWEHRLLVALLCALRQKSRIMNWLAKHAVDLASDARVAQFLSEMFAAGVLRSEIDGLPPQILLMMLENSRDEDTLAKLSNDMNPDEESLVLLAQEIPRLRSLPLWRELF
jgi:hypothetical protein